MKSFKAIVYIKKAVKIYILFFWAVFTLQFGFAQKVSDQKAVSAKKSSKVFYGTASYYANKFNGRKTASGERFNQDKFTCACNVLPLGTWVKITNIKNGRSVVVKVNDRLHAKMNRLADLSRAGATKLGYISAGLTRIKLEVLGKKKPV
jgi:rare lipoprotein A